MPNIVTAVGTAIAVNKALNVMTEQNPQNPRNIWFRIFRAVFWLSLSVACLSVAVWIAAGVFQSISIHFQ